MTLSLEGEVFRGTAEEVIAQIISSSPFRCHESVPEYIRGFARRSGIVGLPEVDDTNPAAFIDSLVQAGLAIRTPFE